MGSSTGGATRRATRDVVDGKLVWGNRGLSLVDGLVSPWRGTMRVPDYFGLSRVELLGAKGGYPTGVTSVGRPRSGAIFRVGAVKLQHAERSFAMWCLRCAWLRSPFETFL